MNRSLLLGLSAALGAALTGATWQVATRHGVTTTLLPLDLAVLRYGVPALLLLPLLPSTLLALRLRPWTILLMALGGGLPFGLLAMGGAVFAPVAHMGALLPGTMPVLTGFLAATVLGDRLTRTRLGGFAIIALGVALIAGRALADRDDQAWIGDLLFLAASLVWAVYSVAFQKSGLTPWQSTALLSAGSAILALPIWAAAGGWARMAAAPAGDLLIQAAAQGLLAGLAGLWTYALAIKHLGAPRAALSGALVPALAALGGWAFLGERPGAATLAGAATICLGILVAGLGPLAPRQPGPRQLAGAPGTAPRPVAAD